MDTHAEYFIIGVLGFQYKGTAQLMNVVGKISFIVIFFYIFYRETFIPRKGQPFFISLEIIFRMALGPTGFTISLPNAAHF